MSDALAARWAAARQKGRAALIPYITAGFPDAAATVAFLQGAGAAGADVIELGVPWSDPVADGPVIQASTHEALRQGMSLAKALDLLERARPSVPAIVFSYLNPILAFGAAKFAARAKAAGAAGVLVTDLPVGTDAAVEAQLRSSGLPLVRLVAPTTTAERAREIAQASEGFVYLISRTGVTGRTDGKLVSRSVTTEPSTDRLTVLPSYRLTDQIAMLRMHTTLPVAVGFGISEPAQAAEVARVADGVVVGSALVERMKSGGAPAALAWLKELRAAMDDARKAA